MYWGGTFGDLEKRRLLQKVPQAEMPPALDSILEGLAGAGGNLQALLAFDQKYFLPDNILTKVDRTSMAHAVEVRLSPFSIIGSSEFRKLAPGQP